MVTILMVARRRSMPHEQSNYIFRLLRTMEPCLGWLRKPLMASRQDDSRRFQWPDCATVLDYLVKHRLKGEGYPAFFSEWNSSELVKETTKLFRDL